MKITEDGTALSLHQEWCRGTDPEGRDFVLSCGAGLGSSAIWFTIDGKRYHATAEDLVKEFIKFHDKETTDALHQE